VHADVAESDAAALVRQVQVNCGAVAAMTTRFLPGMLARRAGTVINVGSTASFQPVPHMAVYGASKAFVLSFTEALWEEVRGTGVRVIALCPGATETEFFETAGEAAKTGRARGVDDLVDHCLRSLSTSKSSTVHGFENALVARVLPRLVPRKVMTAIAGRATGLPAQRSADAVAS
jgi:short-subunit dehydrogenase